MRAVGLICIALLTGCAVFDAPRPVPKWDEMTVHITLTNDLPFATNGRARIVNGECYVELRKSIYPTCLPHEVLHCFGWGHGEQPNQQYCRVE